MSYVRPTAWPARRTASEDPAVPLLVHSARPPRRIMLPVCTRWAKATRDESSDVTYPRRAARSVGVSSISGADVEYFRRSVSACPRVRRAPSSSFGIGAPNREERRRESTPPRVRRPFRRDLPWQRMITTPRALAYTHACSAAAATWSPQKNQRVFGSPEVVDRWISPPVVHAVISRRVCQVPRTSRRENGRSPSPVDAGWGFSRA